MRMTSSTKHPAIAAGKLAVITGGASGIGLAFARKLADRGMKVALIDRDCSALEDGDSGIAGAQLSLHQCDVANLEAMRGLAATITEQHGVPSVLFNNAGAAVAPKPSWEDPEGWRRLLDINLWGVIHSVAAFLPAMIEGGEPGIVLNTGSKQGLSNPPGSGAYNLSKAGVVSYSEFLARELRNLPDSNLSAHLLVPGFTYTGMISRFLPEKPAGAWTSEELVDYALPRLERGDFYLVCPDNDVSVELDAARLQWHLDDLVENRPALSRWHPEYETGFNQVTAPLAPAHTEEPSQVWRTHLLDSQNAYEFVDLVQGLESAPEQKVAATLLRPPRAQGPVPCVIALHGSMGWRGHHHEHAVGLLEQGIAVLRVHSFESRNVDNVVRDQLTVTAAMMLCDAFAGLRLLSGFDEIDASRVGVAGWSLGGQVALYAALEQIAEALAPDGKRFAAHAPVYPAAHITPEDNRWSARANPRFHGCCR